MKGSQVSWIVFEKTQKAACVMSIKFQLHAWLCTSQTDAGIHSKANQTLFHLLFWKGSQGNTSLSSQGIWGITLLGKYSFSPQRLHSQAHQHSPLFHTSLLPCAQALLSPQVSAHQCTSSHGSGCWTAGTRGCTQSEAEEHTAFMDLSITHHCLSKATRTISNILYGQDGIQHFRAGHRHSYNWGPNSLTLWSLEVWQKLWDLDVMTDDEEVKRGTKS